MTPEQFRAFKHDAVHELTRLNEGLRQRFRLGEWERYDYDLERETLTFSQDGTPRVIASIQVVGTTSETAGDWLWGWANAYLPVPVTREMNRVREFGENESLPELVNPYAGDSEDLGWTLTSVAAKILGAQGGYRCPGSNGFIYLVLTDISFADKARISRPRVRCDTHGQAFEAFICEHLLVNPAQKWFSDDPTRENPWPDAWCGQCNALFEELGSWNQRNESKLRIKLICHRCYERLRPSK